MTIEQITNELKLSLIQLLPDRINKIILYGSHARKKHPAIPILIFLLFATVQLIIT
jgi:hypothetical protein